MHHCYKQQFKFSSLLSAGDCQKANKFLAVLDRGETFSRENYHNVAMSYGTLPRAPRRSVSSGPPVHQAKPGLPAGPGPRNYPDAAYATLAHPHRTTASNRTMDGFYRQPHQQSISTTPIPHHSSHHHLRLEPPTQPRRLDIPPERDWRAVRDTRVFPRTEPRGGTSRGPPVYICGLCKQNPAEPTRSYCQTCRAHMNHYRMTSWVMQETHPSTHSFSDSEVNVRAHANSVKLFTQQKAGRSC